jgi:hypothetical protein
MWLCQLPVVAVTLELVDFESDEDVDELESVDEPEDSFVEPLSDFLESFLSADLSADLSAESPDPTSDFRESVR